MRQKEPRLPYAGLVEWLALNNDMDQTGFRSVAKLTGQSVRCLVEWKSTGIPMFSGDKLAIRLGTHPGNIWPEEWWTQ